VTASRGEHAGAAVWGWAHRSLATVRAGLRGPHRRARASIALDQAAITRHLFLASAVAVDAPVHLRSPCSPDELARRIGVPSGPRLDGWLALGVAVGELRRQSGRIHVRGHRLRALVDGDPLTTAWHRSLAGFGTAIPLDLGALLRGEVDRSDLVDGAADIFALAEITDPLVHPVLEDLLAERQPATLLDVGCGDGRLLARALAVRSSLVATGLDQSATAITQSAARFGPGSPVLLEQGALADRADLGSFDLVTSVNAVYYRPPSELAAHVADLAAHVAGDGALLIATSLAIRPAGPVGISRPVDIAAALLDLQLRCQPGGLRLPTRQELLAAVAAAGFEPVPAAAIAPQLPYGVIRARRRR
jgi:SAM-dependent methyltransferase